MAVTNRKSRSSGWKRILVAFSITASGPRHKQKIPLVGMETRKTPWRRRGTQSIVTNRKSRSSGWKHCVLDGPVLMLQILNELSVSQTENPARRDGNSHLSYQRQFVQFHQRHKQKIPLVGMETDVCGPWPTPTNRLCKWSQTENPARRDGNKTSPPR
jgi:hypothetical protein